MSDNGITVEGPLGPLYLEDGAGDLALLTLSDADRLAVWSKIMRGEFVMDGDARDAPESATDQAF